MLVHCQHCLRAILVKESHTCRQSIGRAARCRNTHNRCVEFALIERTFILDSSGWSGVLGSPNSVIVRFERYTRPLTGCWKQDRMARLAWLNGLKKVEKRSRGRPVCNPATHKVSNVGRFDCEGRGRRGGVRREILGPEKAKTRHVPWRAPD